MKAESSESIKSHLLQTIVDSCGSAYIARNRIRRAKAAAEAFTKVIEEDIEEDNQSGADVSGKLVLKQASRTKILLRQNSKTAEASFHRLFDQFALSDQMTLNELSVVIQSLRESATTSEDIRSESLTRQLFEKYCEDVSDKKMMSRGDIETIYALILKDLGNGDGEVTTEIQHLLFQTLSSKTDGTSKQIRFTFDDLFELVAGSQEFQTANEVKQRQILGVTKDMIEQIPTAKTSLTAATKLMNLWDKDGNQKLSLDEWMMGMQNYRDVLTGLGKQGLQIERGLQIFASQTAPLSLPAPEMTNESDYDNGVYGVVKNTQSFLTEFKEQEGGESKKFSDSLLKASELIDSMSSGVGFPDSVLYDLFSATLGDSEIQVIEFHIP